MNVCQLLLNLDLSHKNCVLSNLNYIKQLRLKDHLCLKRHFSMEMLPTHEYGILLVRVGHGEGPHVFTFLISAFFVFEL